VKATASYPADVRDDLAAVLGALADGRQFTTEDLAINLGGALGRVRGALQLLRAANVVSFTTRWHGRNQGYARLWSFTGPGAVHLWEPVQNGRHRRLYVDRGEAINAARRAMGPAAEARPVALLINARGMLGR